MPRASDVTSRDAVLAAIAEFDEIGREAFLARYGFGPSRDYIVPWEGRAYDSKALVGGAYAHQFPGDQPLASEDFSGGDETRRVLERLGFPVVSRADMSFEQTTADAPIKPGIERILHEYAEARLGPFG